MSSVDVRKCHRLRSFFGVKPVGTTSWMCVACGGDVNLHRDEPCTQTWDDFSHPTTCVICGKHRREHLRENEEGRARRCKRCHKQVLGEPIENDGRRGWQFPSGWTYWSGLVGADGSGPYGFNICEVCSDVVRELLGVDRADPLGLKEQK